MKLIATTTDALPAAARMNSWICASLICLAAVSSTPAAAAGGGMNPWTCASLICFAGAVGGAVNALISANGFVLPTVRRAIWCPGFLANLLVGAFAAFASWAFYGGGAGIDVAKQSAMGEPHQKMSLTFSALAGAFLVGVAGAKWITNEVDKKLLKESVKVAGTTGKLTDEECQKLVEGPALTVLDRVERASQAVKAA